MAQYGWYDTGNAYTKVGFTVEEVQHDASDVRFAITVQGKKISGASAASSSSGSAQVYINGSLAHDFSFGNTSIAKDGTVTDFGTVYQSFGAGCGDSFTVYVVLSMPNCSVGSNNKSDTITINIGHNCIHQGSIYSNATCTSPAVYYYACSCGYQDGTTFTSGSALGHDNTATGNLRSAATCTEPATYWYKCSRCGTQSDKYFSSGSAAGHGYPTDFKYESINGVTNGARYKNCTKCGTRLHTQYALYADCAQGIDSVTGQGWYDWGTTATATATPETGSYFTSWSDGDTSNPRSLYMNRAYSITAEANRYAYTVTVYHCLENLSGGWDTHSMPQYTVYYGDSFTPTAITVPTGFYLDTTYKRWANGYSVVRDGGTVGSTAFTVVENTTIEIYYKRNECSVSYDANGGSGAPITTTFKWGAEWTTPSTVPTKTGYTFSHWKSQYDGTVFYAGSSVWTSGRGTDTLSAVWEANTYTITYDGNGATGGSTPNSTHTYDTAKTLNLNGYTKSGYKFVGWARSESFAPMYSDGQSVSNLTSTNGGTITLYAVWEVSANAKINIDGKLKMAMFKVKHNGSYKPALIYCKRSGTWKRTIV